MDDKVEELQNRQAEQIRDHTADASSTARYINETSALQAQIAKLQADLEAQKLQAEKDMQERVATMESGLAENEAILQEAMSELARVSLITFGVTAQLRPFYSATCNSVGESRS